MGLVKALDDQIAASEVSELAIGSKALINSEIATSKAAHSVPTPATILCAVQ